VNDRPPVALGLAGTSHWTSLLHAQHAHRFPAFRRRNGVRFSAARTASLPIPGDCLAAGIPENRPPAAPSAVGVTQINGSNLKHLGH